MRRILVRFNAVRTAQAGVNFSSDPAIGEIGGCVFLGLTMPLAILVSAWLLANPRPRRSNNIRRR